MSGHSKWSTIKRKKEKTDSQRAKIFTKIGRELAVAVRQGGSADPDSNPRLRDCILKAKANNVPSGNIERIIKKAATDPTSDKYESITYEGYGPGGVAVIVKTLTDNRKRTAADLRHYFDKYGGKMGAPGCVSFLFEEVGMLILEKKTSDIDKLLEDCVNAGAIDFFEEKDSFEILVDPGDFLNIKKDLEEKGYNFDHAEITMNPSTHVELTDEDALAKMQKLLDILEDNGDIQAVWHNWR
ncbi:MAG: YebC/PmpR family DNA-binding transcriptional regulator [Oscillospiraceae bacterium]|jgi:YebC/PmpR family DNA-binding regulatory protein|nr:YebC/PmpR family DNA-binding transcriptional regulator [Oscillospiraceae bacterium]